MKILAGYKCVVTSHVRLLVKRDNFGVVADGGNPCRMRAGQTDTNLVVEPCGSIGRSGAIQRLIYLWDADNLVTMNRNADPATRGTADVELVTFRVRLQLKEAIGLRGRAN